MRELSRNILTTSGKMKLLCFTLIYVPGIILDSRGLHFKMVYIHYIQMRVYTNTLTQADTQAPD